MLILSVGAESLNIELFDFAFAVLGYSGRTPSVMPVYVGTYVKLGNIILERPIYKLFIYMYQLPDPVLHMHSAKWPFCGPQMRLLKITIQ